MKKVFGIYLSCRFLRKRNENKRKEEVRLLISIQNPPPSKNEKFFPFLLSLRIVWLKPKSFIGLNSGHEKGPRGGNRNIPYFTITDIPIHGAFHQFTTSTVKIKGEVCTVYGFFG